MKIIVYRKFHTSDLYELTLTHNKYSTEHHFEQNDELRKFSDAFEYEYPFEIIESTELEWKVLAQFLWEVFDIYDIDGMTEDRIYVKKNDEVVDFEWAAKKCNKEIEELDDKIQSLRWDLDLYGEIYHDKYGSRITNILEN